MVNGPYDNDASNFSTPEANDTIYLGVCGHTSMRQGSFVLRNLAHWHTEVRTGMESPLSAPTRPMLSGKMSPAAQKWTPEKTSFVNSGVDFNGESTGKSLEVQIRL